MSRNISKNLGKSKIITDRGKPVLEIRKLRQQQKKPLEVLKSSVLRFEDATDPVAVEDWENA